MLRRVLTFKRGSKQRDIPPFKEGKAQIASNFIVYWQEKY